MTHIKIRPLIKAGVVATLGIGFILHSAASSWSWDDKKPDYSGPWYLRSHHECQVVLDIDSFDREIGKYSTQDPHISNGYVYSVIFTTREGLRYVLYHKLSACETSLRATSE